MTHNQRMSNKTTDTATTVRKRNPSQATLEKRQRMAQERKQIAARAKQIGIGERDFLHRCGMKELETCAVARDVKAEQDARWGQILVPAQPTEAA